MLPLIGITLSKSGHSPRFPDLYADAVRTRGADAVFLDPQSNAETKGRCSGLIIPGGRDLDPAFYLQEESSTIEREEPSRTAFELELLRHAAESRIPVLGICYGMQLLNVAFGGTLYQDIQTDLPPSLDHRAGVHEIRIEENPMVPHGIYEVNSTHHQAVSKYGRGVVPFAFASDGIVEAFYIPEYACIIGVQWHPERMETCLSDQLFRSFVLACNPQKTA